MSTNPVAEPRPGRRYALICPCRDEAEHAQATIDSLAAQTELPALCLFVDDGSSDATPSILARAAAEHPWIRVLTRPDRGVRAVGPGVIEAFNTGYAALDPDSFDYICKIDADLEFPPEYFARVMDAMASHPRLGNYSGKLFHRLASGRLIAEPTGDENAVGNAKFYRVACFREIGGFAPHAGWDGIDGHMCRLKRWIALSEDHPETRIIHRRLMGSSFKSVFHGRKRWGKAKWYMGTSLFYMLFVTAYRMKEKPVIVGGLGILIGYLGAMLSGYPRHGTAAFRRHLRAFEHRSLLRGKSGATREANESIRRWWDEQPGAGAA